MKINASYRSIRSIEGPILIIDKVKSPMYNELVKIKLDNNEEKLGQVIECSSDYAVVEIFGSNIGLGKENIGVEFTADTFKVRVGDDMIGRVFNGEGKPIDNNIPIIGNETLDINGLAINPASRDMPNDFIETGISAIDGLNTLVRGQKLSIFSASGLPHNEITAQIIRQANVLGKEGDFLIVFAGIGITYDSYLYFIKEFSNIQIQ